MLTLAEEILELGPNDGRGIRLAALTLRMNEAMNVSGEVPYSWRPPAPIPSYITNEIDVDEIDRAWNFDSSEEISIDDSDIEILS